MVVAGRRPSGDYLDGLSVHYDSRFIADILKTVARYPEPDLAHALNYNQTASKKWLANALHETLGGDLGTVHVLGGWYGILGAMLLHDQRFAIRRLVSIDIEAACKPVAESLNRANAGSGRFQAMTADMHDMDYTGSGAPDLIINTSCEHLERFADWYATLPAGMVLVLQSNDFFACTPHHVNCVADLAAFKAQAPMAEVLFAGALDTKNYTRFMLIGRK